MFTLVFLVLLAIVSAVPTTKGERKLGKLSWKNSLLQRVNLKSNVNLYDVRKPEALTCPDYFQEYIAWNESGYSMLVQGDGAPTFPVTYSNEETECLWWAVFLSSGDDTKASQVLNCLLWKLSRLNRIVHNVGQYID